MAEPDLKTTIETAAAQPSSISGDEGSVTMRPIGELIEADRHLKQNAAVQKVPFGIRVARIIPPGAGS